MGGKPGWKSTTRSCGEMDERASIHTALNFLPSSSSGTHGLRSQFPGPSKSPPFLSLDRNTSTLVSFSIEKTLTWLPAILNQLVLSQHTSTMMSQCLWTRQHRLDRKYYPVRKHKGPAVKTANVKFKRVASEEFHAEFLDLAAENAKGKSLALLIAWSNSTSTTPVATHWVHTNTTAIQEVRDAMAIQMNQHSPAIQEIRDTAERWTMNLPILPSLVPRPYIQTISILIGIHTRIESQLFRSTLVSFFIDRRKFKHWWKFPKTPSALPSIDRKVIADAVLCRTPRQ